MTGGNSFVSFRLNNINVRDGAMHEKLAIAIICLMNLIRGSFLFKLRVGYPHPVLQVVCLDVLLFLVLVVEGNGFESTHCCFIRKARC